MEYVALMKSFYVYIMASHKHGTLYVGFTSNPTKRIWEHNDIDLAKAFEEKWLVHEAGD